MSFLGWKMGVVPYQVVMTASACHQPKYRILSSTKCHQTGVKISHCSVAWAVTTGHKNQIWSNQPQLSPSTLSWKVWWWLSPHFKYWAVPAGVRMISIDRTWVSVCVSCVNCDLCCVLCGLRRTSETEDGRGWNAENQEKKVREGSSSNSSIQTSHLTWPFHTAMTIYLNANSYHTNHG